MRLFIGGKAEEDFDSSLYFYTSKHNKKSSYETLVLACKGGLCLT